MNILFIDTNIYLQFYDTNQPEYKKLLGSLVELKDSIFITNQIVDEINKNKLSIFQSSTGSYKKQIQVIRTHLPEHFVSPQGLSIEDPAHVCKATLCKYIVTKCIS